MNNIVVSDRMVNVDVRQFCDLSDIDKSALAMSNIDILKNLKATVARSAGDTRTEGFQGQCTKFLACLFPDDLPHNGIRGTILFRPPKPIGHNILLPHDCRNGIHFMAKKTIPEE